jgi:hypothetical protein
MNPELKISLSETYAYIVNKPMKMIDLTEGNTQI